MKNIRQRDKLLNMYAPYIHLNVLLKGVPTFFRTLHSSDPEEPQRYNFCLIFQVSPWYCFHPHIAAQTKMQTEVSCFYALRCLYILFIKKWQLQCMLGVLQWQAWLNDLLRTLLKNEKKLKTFQASKLPHADADLVDCSEVQPRRQPEHKNQLHTSQVSWCPW